MCSSSRREPQTWNMDRVDQRVGKPTQLRHAQDRRLSHKTLGDDPRTDHGGTISKNWSTAQQLPGLVPMRGVPPRYLWVSSLFFLSVPTSRLLPQCAWLSVVVFLRDRSMTAVAEERVRTARPISPQGLAPGTFLDMRSMSAPLCLMTSGAGAFLSATGRWATRPCQTLRRTRAVCRLCWRRLRGHDHGSGTWRRSTRTRCGTTRCLCPAQHQDSKKRQTTPGEENRGKPISTLSCLVTPDHAPRCFFLLSQYERVGTHRPLRASSSITQQPTTTAKYQPPPPPPPHNNHNNRNHNKHNKFNNHTATRDQELTTAVGWLSCPCCWGLAH